MEEVLDEVVSSEDLKKFEREYHEQLYKSQVTTSAQFNYAWCLVRSKYPADIRKGILLLEDLYQDNQGDERRDYLYYLAIGNARIKEYSKALNYVRSFLNLEPANAQVQALEATIKKRMEKEGLMGMALAGTAVLAMGGLVALGVALAKGKS
ncbi:mitochondrial fission 1 protein-like [Homalodisca vitripennis]|uniref:mitochondrial fission 1 protein-like n=1 Tax=Homalodisca vitripennis TaxID=197043 RepID=UPI001EEBAEB3|nr:mitochondrial fission 1 protein-like [Homalodisca vitripennis]